MIIKTSGLIKLEWKAFHLHHYIFKGQKHFSTLVTFVLCFLEWFESCWRIYLKSSTYMTLNRFQALLLKRFKRFKMIHHYKNHK